MDAVACNYAAESDFADNSCDYSCLRCTDPTALNYNEATVDDGSCVGCDAGTFLLQVDMEDSGNNGWDGAEYSIYDENGALQASGDLDNAFIGDGQVSGTDLLCLAPGCYTFELSPGSLYWQPSATISDNLGNTYVEDLEPSYLTNAVYNLDFLLTGLCGYEGCTNPVALNFDPSATVDDESCQVPPANDNIAGAQAIACGASVTGTFEYASDNEGLDDTVIGQDELGAIASGTSSILLPTNKSLA